MQTWLPGDAAGATVSTLEVYLPRSSRTKGSASQFFFHQQRTSYHLFRCWLRSYDVPPTVDRNQTVSRRSNYLFHFSIRIEQIQVKKKEIKLRHECLFETGGFIQSFFKQVRKKHKLSFLSMRFFECSCALNHSYSFLKYSMYLYTVRTISSRFFCTRPNLKDLLYALSLHMLSFIYHVHYFPKA